MQRRLDRGHGAVEHDGDLLQRMAEHVHQDDAAALRDRQAHQGAQAGGGGLAAVDLAVGIGDHVEILVGTDILLARAAAQEIERRVVGDAEQPALGLGDRAGAGKASIAFTSASCSTSSPSMTEPVMREQYRCSLGRSSARSWSKPARGSFMQPSDGLAGPLCQQDV